MSLFIPFVNDAPSLMPSPNLPVLGVVLAAASVNFDIQGFVEGDSVDSVVISEDDSVALMAQTDASENGVYVLSAQGLERREDFSSASYIAGGAIVPVSKGSVNGGKAFKVAPPGGALGEVNIVFSEYEEWQGPQTKTPASQSFSNTAPDLANLESQEFDTAAPEALSVEDLSFSEIPPEENSVASQAFDTTAPNEIIREDQSFENTPPDSVAVDLNSWNTTPPDIMT